MAKVHPVSERPNSNREEEIICPYLCVVINSSQIVANHRLTGKEICCTYLCYFTILFFILLIPILVEYNSNEPLILGLKVGGAFFLSIVVICLLSILRLNCLDDKGIKENYTESWCCCIENK
jgi:hypothetical protein